MSHTVRLLSQIERGKGLNAISADLGLRVATVRAIVESMVHRGYVEKLACTSGGGCTICPMNCGAHTASRSNMYVVTDKGMAYLNANGMED